jgi:hypothetical protein
MIISCSNASQCNEKFTYYYPTPQISDQPKLQITRHGAIWSDMRNIKALAALYRS